MLVATGLGHDRKTFRQREWNLTLSGGTDAEGRKVFIYNPSSDFYVLFSIIFCYKHHCSEYHMQLLVSLGSIRLFSWDKFLETEFLR